MTKCELLDEKIRWEVEQDRWQRYDPPIVEGYMPSTKEYFKLYIAGPIDDLYFETIKVWNHQRKLWEVVRKTKEEKAAIFEWFEVEIFEACNIQHDYTPEEVKKRWEERQEP